MRRLSYIIDERMDGRTVEYALRHGLHAGAHAVRHAKFVDDGIMLDGVRVHANVPVRVGQTVSIVIGDTEDAVKRSQVLAIFGDIDVVFEDEDLLIIDKPAGIVMHPGTGHREDTLGNLVMGYYAERGIQAGFHPVHRLDKGTSGLVVIAKNAHAQNRLQQTLHTTDFRRVYLALCVGCPCPTIGVVDAPIGFDPQCNSVRCIAPDGKSARTRYRVIASNALSHPQCGDRLSLVELVLETGRTHQIRIHMASMGSPLLGDEVYGVMDARIARPALHSASLSIVHPVLGTRLAFDSPLPPDMEVLNSELLGNPAL